MGRHHRRRFLVIQELREVSSAALSFIRFTNSQHKHRYFRKFEHFVANPVFSPYTSFSSPSSPAKGSSVKEGEGEVGLTGPVEVGFFNYVSETSKSFVRSCINVGIPYTPSFNGASGTAGVSRVSQIFLG